MIEQQLDVLIQSPSTQHPPHWRFAAVDGALCRLERMGAPAILRPLTKIRTTLETLVEGFNWMRLCLCLPAPSLGGKDGTCKTWVGFKGGHVCNILDERVHTI